MQGITRRFTVVAGIGVVALIASFTASADAQPASHSSSSARSMFTAAAHRSGVPAPLLEAICYLEGRLSMHAGHPSIDHGYGCMHLVANDHSHTLRQAARDLGVSQRQLRLNMATNVLGGAMVLRDEARALSPTHSLPTRLGGWYGAVAKYSGAVTRSTATMYANAVYKVLRQGFTGHTDSGQLLVLAPERVGATKSTAASIRTQTADLPAGCQRDSKVDYSPAIDCIVKPKIFDCNISHYKYPGCTYLGANRPSTENINGIVIHDIEGTAQDGLNVFQDHNSGVSIQYVVDTDGTVYQCLHEADIAYQDGNFWSNLHTIGIEHAGFDANGYDWYNATEYLASAQLVAYLLTKYDLPLDRGVMLSHGTVPSPNYLSENHVDPGPYWMWDYYMGLIHDQGVPYSQPSTDPHLFAVHTDQQPQADGSETPSDFGFFYLYNGPSTDSGRIPSLSNDTDITDESDNVEAGLSYYYLDKQPDAAGTGDTMYEVWYGEHDQASGYQDAKTAWIAVPPTADVVEGVGTKVTIQSPDGNPVFVYGRPTASSSYILGGAPDGATFASMLTVGSTKHPKKLWYEIDFNHRQAYVPATEVTVG